MCVKEFLGFICGHCAVPFLVKCPRALHDPQWPICIAAEHSITTNEYCPGCARIVWNANTIKLENEHWGLHKRGECQCEIIFDPEERERRLRPRSGKGKSKAKENLKDQDVQVTQATAAVGEANVGRGSRQGYRRDFEECSGIAQSVPAEAGLNYPRQTWIPEAQRAAYDYVGYIGDTNMGRTTVGAPSQMEMEAAMAHAAQGYGFPEGGWAPRSMLWSGQMMTGQPGAGMKWYPQSQVEAMPALPEIPTPPTGRKRYDKAPRVWQKAMSEPTDASSYLGSPSTTMAEMFRHFGCRDSEYDGYEAPTLGEQVKSPEVPHEPIIVSSDMGKNKS